MALRDGSFGHHGDLPLPSENEGGVGGAAAPIEKW